MDHLSSFIQYLEVEKKYAKHTIIAYRADITAFSLYYTQVLSFSDITKASYKHIRLWIVCLMDDGFSARTVNRKVAALKSFYVFLYRCHLIDKNPLDHHTSLSYSVKRQIPFSQQQMHFVLDRDLYPKSFIGVRDYCILLLFYTTGIRRSELISLKVSSVDFSNNTIKVLGKGAKERVLPLLVELKDALEQYLAYRCEINTTQNSFLFLTKNANKIYEMLVYRVVNTYFSKASIKVKKSPHMLRHTFATHLLANGADINAVKALLGHASLAATQVYLHNDIALLKAAYTDFHPREE